jgi:tetratricopeptide (TPR) repeat protein
VVTALAWWNPGGVATSLTRRLTSTDSGHSRLALWEVAWSVFRSHPILGCGPDALGVVFGEHRTPAQWQAETFTDATRAHNELLHILATQGILGLAALMVVLLGLLLANRRAWQTAPPQHRGLLLALFASLAAFLVVSALSYTVVGYGVGFVAMAGLLSRLASPRRALASAPENAAAPAAPPARAAILRPALVMLVSLSLAAAWFFSVVQPFRASIAAAAGNTLCRDNPADALPFLEKAVALQPGNDQLWLLLAGGQQAAAHRERSPDRRLKRLHEARATLEHAQALNPRRAAHPLNLAKVRAQLAAAEQAAVEDVWAAFAQALRLDPCNPAVHMEASLAALTLNDANRARQYAEAGLQLDPRFGPLLSQLGYLALRDNKPSEALDLLLRAEEGRWIDRPDWRVASLSNLAAAQSQLGQDATAAYTLSQALTIAPQSQPLRLFRARLLERLGREAEALDEYRRILDLAPDHPLARQAIERAGPIRRVSTHPE